GFQSFADVQAHLADDANGNAMLTLGDGQTIAFMGVHTAQLTADDFLFEVTPVTGNDGSMIVSDGALLPLSGVINNTGVIALASHGAGGELELIQHGITLQGGGTLAMSDNAGNTIEGTGSDVLFTNVDNFIMGAGNIGDGSLMLVNEGTIAATGENALVID